MQGNRRRHSCGSAMAMHITSWIFHLQLHSVRMKTSPPLHLSTMRITMAEIHLQDRHYGRAIQLFIVTLLLAETEVISACFIRAHMQWVYAAKKKISSGFTTITIMISCVMISRKIMARVTAITAMELSAVSME